jgi:predicted neutral ceramidase superfamily lipid hydrolase
MCSMYGTRTSTVYSTCCSVICTCSSASFEAHCRPLGLFVFCSVLLPVNRILQLLPRFDPLDIHTSIIYSNTSLIYFSPLIFYFRSFIVQSSRSLFHIRLRMHVLVYSMYIIFVALCRSALIALQLFRGHLVPLPFRICHPLHY